MEKPVEIEVMGHKAQVKWIKGHPANPPLHPEDTLSAFIELVEPVNGTSGYFIDIPVRNYGKDELRETIQVIAEETLGMMLEQSRKEKAARECRECREKDLNHLGEQLLDMLSK